MQLPLNYLQSQSLDRWAKVYPSTVGAVPLMYNNLGSRLLEVLVAFMGKKEAASQFLLISAINIGNTLKLPKDEQTGRSYSATTQNSTTTSIEYAMVGTVWKAVICRTACCELYFAVLR